MKNNVSNVSNTVIKNLVRNVPETLLFIKNIAQVRAVDEMMAEAKRIKILITDWNKPKRVNVIFFHSDFQRKTFLRYLYRVTEKQVRSTGLQLVMARNVPLSQTFTRVSII